MKIRYDLSLLAALYFCSAFMLRAGHVTASPPADSIQNIAVDEGSTVQFQAESDSNDGTVEFDRSLCSFGSGTDTNFDSSGGTATVFVTFGSAALGSDNPVYLYVNHWDPTGTTCSTDQPVNFNVIVPQCTLDPESTLDPGGTIAGTVNNSLNTLSAQNFMGWEIDIEVHPLDAVPYVTCELSQDIQGTITKNNRSGSGGTRQSISSSALDGESTVQTPAGGYILMQSSDEAGQIDSAVTFSNFVFNDSFSDYVQYAVVNGSGQGPWHTIGLGSWTETGTVSASGSTGAWTESGSTTSAIQSNFTTSSASPVESPADKGFYSF